MTTTPINLNDDLTGMSYERARDELVEVVRRLESGTASLAEAMELWQVGEKLAAYCQHLLEAARATVAQAAAEALPDGGVEAEEDEDQAG
jgi:exodeoxyribonuclease VII small subunit